jgi:hypothetical protein
MELQSKIWGPHYWFVLNTIAISYPLTPNKVTKKKYYDFIMNLPLFIPNIEMGNKFSGLLDKYPVTPYLDSRESFIKWIHFIHNRVNETIGKEPITYQLFLEKYYDHYKEKTVTKREKKIRKEYYIYSILLFALIGSIIYFK